ncbi:MAG: NADP-dependent malic enzyme [Gammaproteobacteria bacterium]|nr:MAG: NADP-dependent malic enzyme [Gammaproteobacteria bacterium]
MAEDLDECALEYHRENPPGKISVVPTKPLANQRDLALAYSPGVAAACRVIEEDPLEAATVTARSNLVGVISNGTAVLGLGDIGPLAAKPVMEGKGVLFKKFAGIDVFDLEIKEKNPDQLVEIIASLEPTFGGINLEDIKAPECFMIEGKLRERLNIPVFHDDQHGTAIIVSAAIFNGLDIVGKKLENIRVVTSGAGASAQGCLKLLISMGLPKENILAVDRQGVIYKGRPGLRDPHKRRFANSTDCRTLSDALVGADVFLGLSGPGTVTQEMLKGMADRPLVFALANPVPEIMPEEIRQARPDALIATGRSDYPNQVNNVLCFPFMFRGALDVGATQINDSMMIACATALADLAKQETSDVVNRAYSNEHLSFGPDYLIPKPFDPRLNVEVSYAVAKAAMDSGVASRPIKDMGAYRQRLSQMVNRSGLFMKPFFDRARNNLKRVVFAEGENETVLRAVQEVVDEALAIPILMGRQGIITEMIKELGLRIQPGEDFEVIDPRTSPLRQTYSDYYYELVQRKGITPGYAAERMRGRGTVWGLTMLRRDEADAVICGTMGKPDGHLQHVLDIIGLQDDVNHPGILHVMLMPKGTFFVAHTVNPDPTCEQVVETTLLAADTIKQFGVRPKVALLSYSSFGSGTTESARRMQNAVRQLDEIQPDFQYEGEMQADAALLEDIRKTLFPNSRLQGRANLLIMPNRDAAHIAFNMVKVLGDSVAVGPILLGVKQPVHILTSSATVRRVVNMTAIAAVKA